MIINVITFLAIIFLMVVNGLTDASNSIATVVGTRVLNYRKACIYSGLFNILGLFCMYFMNTSVADTISEIVILPQDQTGTSVLLISFSITIFFSIISMAKGIPASESYGLIFSLLGAGVSFYGIRAINFSRIIIVLIALLYSVLGSIIISKIFSATFIRLIEKLNDNIIKKMQIVSALGMSFAHGAQDGLKFVGILRLYQMTTLGEVLYENELIILFICALSMALGTMIGGKRIVISVGEKLTKLNNKNALMSDFSAIFTLISGSFFKMPLSTSHVKTMSIVGAANNNELNKKKIFEMIIVWIVVLPLCATTAFAYGLLFCKK